MVKQLRFEYIFMNLVFLKFKAIWLLLAQLEVIHKSVDKEALISGSSQPWVRRVESSAKRGCDVVRKDGRSLINIKNSNGPRMEP